VFVGELKILESMGGDLSAMVSNFIHNGSWSSTDWLIIA
jgi:hypothetical protein